ncbi:MAG: hypothetical protein D4R67_07665 [Bacteroidetes bacterium]|nr:MAG: hypothetical protein D4R67_07665 [Bacteroidota bacterium]
MRNKLIIPGLLLALILFSAKRCDEGPPDSSRLEEAEWMNVRDSLEQEFGSAYLDEETLHAFEMRAIQKLQDYTEYRNMFCTDSLDMVFRTQADSMIANLFMQGMVPQIVQQGTAELFLDSVRVLEPLHQSGPEEYRGRLSFVQCFVDRLGDEPITGKPESHLVDVYAVRQTVPLAQDTLDIWRVLLGVIY